jgi:hypothetical protein
MTEMVLAVIGSFSFLFLMSVGWWPVYVHLLSHQTGLYPSGQYHRTSSLASAATYRGRRGEPAAPGSGLSAPDGSGRLTLQWSAALQVARSGPC